MIPRVPAALVVLFLCLIFAPPVFSENVAELKAKADQLRAEQAKTGQTIKHLEHIKAVTDGLAVKAALGETPSASELAAAAEWKARSAAGDPIQALKKQAKETHKTIRKTDGAVEKQLTKDYEKAS